MCLNAFSVLPGPVAPKLQESVYLAFLNLVRTRRPKPTGFVGWILISVDITPHGLRARSQDQGINLLTLCGEGDGNWNVPGKGSEGIPDYQSGECIGS